MFYSTPIESSMYWQNGLKMNLWRLPLTIKTFMNTLRRYYVSSLHLEISRSKLGWLNRRNFRISYIHFSVSVLIETCLTAPVAHTTNQLLSFRMVWYERHRSLIYNHPKLLMKLWIVKRANKLHASRFQSKPRQQRVSSRTKAAHLSDCTIEEFARHLRNLVRKNCDHKNYQ